RVRDDDELAHPLGLHGERDDVAERARRLDLAAELQRPLQARGAREDDLPGPGKELEVPDLRAELLTREPADRVDGSRRVDPKRLASLRHVPTGYQVGGVGAALTVYPHPHLALALART